MNRRDVILIAAALPLAPIDALAQNSDTAEGLSENSFSEYTMQVSGPDELSRALYAVNTIIYLVSLLSRDASEKLLHDRQVFFERWGEILIDPKGVYVLNEDLIKFPDRVANIWPKVVQASNDLQKALATLVKPDAEIPLIKGFGRASALIGAHEQNAAWWCELYGLRSFVKC